MNYIDPTSHTSPEHPPAQHRVESLPSEDEAAVAERDPIRHAAEAGVTESIIKGDQLRPVIPIEPPTHDYSLAGRTATHNSLERPPIASEQLSTGMSSWGGAYQEGMEEEARRIASEAYGLSGEGQRAA